MNPTTPCDELWGTFAVDDHKRTRAFVAEVVLFDRLVVPQPPENDAEERAAWVKEDWQPDRLKETVDVHGDLAIPISWDNELRTAWQGESASRFEERRSRRQSLAHNASFDFQSIKNRPPAQPAMWVTRLVLANKLNA